MQRRFIALEREPDGQFLALHGFDESDDFSEFMGKWVEFEGDIWFQSLTARSVREIRELQD